ncbi:unnamed protein product [marine sediment metagenome]|uniref:Polymerase nucleotidyl transferase domain-containing protein n=1 Tax=marine sediment metagenome TaxID=412755 RepID=X0UN36_9ZZZZ
MNILELRKKKEKYSQKKLKIAKKTANFLKFIPWIKVIGITGALAMHNSDKDDDIDFLIITQRDRLWLTRLLIVFFLEILGKRRRPNDKKIKDKICLNMFLDEFTLSLSKTKRNLFTAHEIVQMSPIYNKDNTYERFLRANLWVKKYLPNSLKDTSEVARSDSSEVEGSCILNLLENLAYQFQSKYMKSKITSERISPHFAFFHPKDRSREILVKYKHAQSETFQSR